MNIIDDPAHIKAYREFALRGALKLEVVGLRKHGRSAYAIVKEEYGFKGNKQQVLEQLNAHLWEKYGR